MTTTQAGEFSDVFTRRVKALEFLAQVRQDRTEEVELSDIGDIATRLSNDALSLQGVCGARYLAFAELLSAVEMLLRWRSAIRGAEVDADRYLRAAHQRTNDLLERLSPEEFSTELLNAANAIRRIAEVSEVENAVDRLAAASLPLPLKRTSTRRRGIAAGQDTRKSKPPEASPRPPVAVLAFGLDGEPLSSGMVIQPNVVHDLEVSVALSTWPEEAEELILEPVSVELPAVFQLPAFRFPAGDYAASREFKMAGRLYLSLPQAIRSRPLEFLYRAALIAEQGREIPVAVEGQRQFTVRSHDPGTQPITGSTEVDLRLLDIRGELRRITGLSNEDRKNFLKIMAELGQIAAESLASNRFHSANWDEERWHHWLKTELRRRPNIGFALEEHPSSGGGITDLSFHRVRLELKAESRRLVSIDDAKGFLPQTAQYVVGSDKRLGVLAILDVSPKDDAPGSVGNGIFLEAVPDAGGGEIPIAIGVVIVRGNLARPSDLSR